MIIGLVGTNDRILWVAPAGSAIYLALAPGDSSARLFESLCLFSIYFILIEYNLLSLVYALSAVKLGFLIYPFGLTKGRDAGSCDCLLFLVFLEI